MRKTGRDWLIQLLINYSKKSYSLIHQRRCVKIIFMLWRAWHHQNNIVHGNGKALAASMLYLINYEASYASASMIQMDMKGKGAICPIPAPLIPDELEKSVRQPPPTGWTKINVDAGWDVLSMQTQWHWG
jgi:hypothetical protein